MSNQPAASKMVQPKTKQPQNAIDKAKAEALAEAQKMESLKAQSNVEISEDNQVVTLGVDEYDRWVKEFFKLASAPGFTPNYSRPDFPDFGEGPVAVSRCYYNKPDGKHLVLDILQEGEYTAAQLKTLQATLRKLGFHYTWTIQGEEVSLDEIFEKRLNQKNEAKPIIKAMVQDNVVVVNG